MTARGFEVWNWPPKADKRRRGAVLCRISSLGCLQVALFGPRLLALNSVAVCAAPCPQERPRSR